MRSLRSLVALFGALFGILCCVFTVSCSDKGRTPPPTSTVNQLPANQLPANQPAGQPVEQPHSDETSVTSDEDTIPPIENQVTEKNVDPYTSEIISQIKDQLSHDPLSHEKRIKNVEFANRIFEVDFDYTSKAAHLNLVTHTSKTFNFQYVSRTNNVLYFNAYEHKRNILDRSSRSTVYSAAVTILSESPEKIIALIKIKDIETTAIVNIFYVQKTGSLVPVFIKNNDYASDLTKTSKVFLQRITENPKVEGDFYSVITEERNISNASKFKLTVSDNFTLESAPILDAYRDDQPTLAPLMVDYKSFWKMFFFGSTAYKVIKDASYIIESPRNPVELTALNLDLKIEAKEKIKGQKNTLPLQFHVKLK